MNKLIPRYIEGARLYTVRERHRVVVPNGMWRGQKLSVCFNPATPYHFVVAPIGVAVPDTFTLRWERSRNRNGLSIPHLIREAMQIGEESEVACHIRGPWVEFWRIPEWKMETKREAVARRRQAEAHASEWRRLCERLGLPIAEAEVEDVLRAAQATAAGGER